MIKNPDSFSTLFDLQEWMERAGVTKSNTFLKNLSSPDDRRVTSLYTDILKILSSKPNRAFSPKEISQILKINPDAVKQALGRKSTLGKNSGPIVKVGYGKYQYCEEKADSQNSGLKSLLLHYGRGGFENLIYVTLPATPIKNDLKFHGYAEGENLPVNEGNCYKSLTPSTAPSPREGYPKDLPTGQEIQWECWSNGTEQVSFISNGNPFSLDFIIYLHQQLEGEGLKGDKWHRIRCEANIDGQRIMITPDSATVQSTRRLLLKVYNRGMQARYEVVDRHQFSLKIRLMSYSRCKNQLPERKPLKRLTMP